MAFKFKTNGGNASETGNQKETRAAQDVRRNAYMAPESTTNANSTASQMKFAQKINQTLGSIDRQAPGLTYMGLGCWMAWNSIGFSGSFWLHEIENSVVSENLMLAHLLACVTTLILLAAFAEKASKWVAKNSVTFAGAIVACIGTIILCCARPAILDIPTETLGVMFNFGCVLSGVGTTFLFIRAAALFGTLPPHRALYQLSACTLFSIVVYFILNGCPQEVATVCFILLPLLSAGLYALRAKDVRGERQVLKEQAPLNKKFAILLLSIGLCSTAIELIRSFVLINIPTAYAVSANANSQLIEIPLMAGIMLVVMLAKSKRDSFAKLYSIAAGALTVLIMAMAMFSLNTPAIAAGAWVICTCYNMVVWAMLFYLVFQWKAGAVRVMALGNAALSGGTIVAGFLAMAYQASHISNNSMRILIAVIGIAVAVDVIFFFSEKQIDALLLPVDESQDLLPLAGAGRESKKQAGKWKETCGQIAQEAGLSSRETEIFMSLARGHSAQEIAEKDVVSIYTVRAHTRSIYAKLDVHSKKELSDLIREQLKSAEQN